MINAILLSEQENKKLQEQLLKFYSAYEFNLLMNKLIAYKGTFYRANQIPDTIFYMTNKVILDNLYITIRNQALEKDFIQSLNNNTFFDSLIVRHVYLSQVLNILFSSEHDKLNYEQEIKKMLNSFLYNSFKQHSTELNEPIFGMFNYLRSELSHVKPPYHIFEFNGSSRPIFMY